MTYVALAALGLWLILWRLLRHLDPRREFPPGHGAVALRDKAPPDS